MILSDWELIPHPNHVFPLSLSTMECARGDALGKSMSGKYFKMNFSLHNIPLSMYNAFTAGSLSGGYKEFL